MSAERELVKALSAAQVASLAINLMEFYNARREQLSEIVKGLDDEELRLFINAAVATPSSASANRALRYRARLLLREGARRVHNPRLYQKRLAQFRAALMDAGGESEIVVDEMFRSALLATLARTHFLRDQSLVPKSIKRQMERLEKGELDEEAEE